MIKSSLTFVLSLLLLVISQNQFVTGQKSIVTYNQPSSGYVDWYPLPSSQTFKFRFRGSAFTIILGTYPVNEYPNIEIGICHPSSTSYGIIWRNNAEVVSLNIDNKYYTSDRKFTSYWVTWYNNNIKIGIEGETNAFLSYDDPNPYQISFIGIHVPATSKPGIWIVENN